jgi:hypothetical protein
MNESQTGMKRQKKRRKRRRSNSNMIIKNSRRHVVLHDKIKKQKEVHKTKSIAENDRLSI